MDSTAPLSCFYISERNVRKIGRDIDTEEMADSLAARGVIERLHVVDEGRRGAKGEVMLGVHAGGRRLLGLQRLAARAEEAGAWPTDRIDPEAIPITFDPPEEAREISLAENVHTVPMNPADEAEAYAAIVAEYEARGEAGPDVRLERCARHFGKTVRYVEQRLRLAGLEPEIFAALRTDRIGLDAARAYAIVADHKVQRDIFDAQERQGGEHRVAAIRAAIAGLTYRVADRQVLYVGLDAYVAAGGRVDRDLFMGGEGDEVVLDTALVDRLAAGKAEAEGLKRAAEAGFAGAVLKLWGAASWQPARAPEGFARVFTLRGLGDEERRQALVVCAIAADGSRVELLDEGFRPCAAPTTADGAAEGAAEGLGGMQEPATAAGTAMFVRPGETELERIARIRRRRVEEAALRLALPRLEGTPLEGRIFMPPAGAARLEPVQAAEDAFALAVYVRIPRADVERRMAEAEQLVDREDGGPPPPPKRPPDDPDWDEPAPAPMAAAAAQRQPAEEMAS